MNIGDRIEITAGQHKGRTGTISDFYVSGLNMKPDDRPRLAGYEGPLLYCAPGEYMPLGSDCITCAHCNGTGLVHKHVQTAAKRVEHNTYPCPYSRAGELQELAQSEYDRHTIGALTEPTAEVIR